MVQANATERNPRMSLCSTIDLKGAPVRDRRGRCIGKIRDVVLFARKGVVSYAVVGFGGLFGIGEQRVAIPWTRIRVAPSGRWVHLDEGRDVLEEAPATKPRTMVNFGDPEAHATMYRQYAVHRGGDAELCVRRAIYVNDRH